MAMENFSHREEGQPIVNIGTLPEEIFELKKTLNSMVENNNNEEFKIPESVLEKTKQNIREKLNHLNLSILEDKLELLKNEEIGQKEEDDKCTKRYLEYMHLYDKKKMQEAEEKLDEVQKQIKYLEKAIELKNSF